MQELQEKIRELKQASVQISYDEPDWIAKMDAQRELQKRLMNELKHRARMYSTLLGRIVSFPVADGEALYVVTKIMKSKVKVEWIPWLDEYMDDRLGNGGTLPINYVQEKVNWEDYRDALIKNHNTNPTEQ